jgi:DNA-binding MarR family transcriptional regulator
MMSRLQEELKQSKPFDSPEVEAYLNLVRSAALLTRQQEEVLKQQGLTSSLYNVLRIVRGAGGDGIPSTSVADRMVSRVPDVTRLVDRLVALGLVERHRTDADRRLVILRLSTSGASLLTELDEPTAALHKGQLAHMTRDELVRLNELLVKARANLST